MILKCGRAYNSPQRLFFDAPVSKLVHQVCERVDARVWLESAGDRCPSAVKCPFSLRKGRAPKQELKSAFFRVQSQRSRAHSSARTRRIHDTSTAAAPCPESLDSR